MNTVEQSESQQHATSQNDCVRSQWQYEEAALPERETIFAINNAIRAQCSMIQIKLLYESANIIQDDDGEQWMVSEDNQAEIEKTGMLSHYWLNFECNWGRPEEV
jgi:hypothetical protein